MIDRKIAVALYTLRDVLPNRLPEAMRSLKEMGCAGVEVGEYFGYTVYEVAEMLRETGVKMVALHRNAEDFNDPQRWERTLEEARLLQTEVLGFPGVGPESRTEQGYTLHKQQLYAAAKKVAEHGFRLIYHNHDFELRNRVNVLNALDFLLEPGKDSLVQVEFDVYWLAKGGQDPLAYMSKYPNRVPILHMKDMTADERQTYAELGSGSLDFPPMVAWGERNGVEWYMIEQDICPGNPWDSVQISMDYLLRLKV